MNNFILSLWITIKCFYSKIVGWIGKLDKEIECISKLDLKTCNYSELNKIGIVYKRDLLNNKQWDFQFDSVEVIKRKGGDCNSLNRVVQVYYHMQDFKTYLVTYIAKPFKMSHSTCIGIKNGKYYCLDYGYILEMKNLKECFLYLENIYHCKMIGFVIQDINWKIIKNIY